MEELNLILAAKNNDTEAINQIVKNYKKLIYSIINNYSINTSDYDLSKEDMFQEGLIGLMQAIKSYDETRDVRFSTFAYPIISRRIIKEYKRQYNRYEQEGYSYSKYDEVDHFYYQKTNYVQDNPIEYYENKTREDLLFEIIEDLENEDKEIVKLRIKAYTYEEIANELNITCRKVDYRLRRIKKLIAEKKKTYYPN